MSAFPSLAIAAALVALPALAAAEINAQRQISLVTAIDLKARTMILGDRSTMPVAAEVPLTKDLVGQRVEISTIADEDGMEPARSVKTLN